MALPPSYIPSRRHLHYFVLLKICTVCAFTLKLHAPLWSARGGWVRIRGGSVQSCQLVVLSVCMHLPQFWKHACVGSMRPTLWSVQMHPALSRLRPASAGPKAVYMHTTLSHPRPVAAQHVQRHIHNTNGTGFPLFFPEVAQKLDSSADNTLPVSQCTKSHEHTRRAYRHSDSGTGTLWDGVSPGSQPHTTPSISTFLLIFASCTFHRTSFPRYWF